MSVRTSATTQNYYKNLALGSQTKVSFSLWVKISVDRNANSAPFMLRGADDNDVFYLSTNVDGTQMLLFDQTVYIVGPQMTVGTWYFFGVSRNGTSGSMVWRTPDSPTWSSVTGSSFAASNTFTDLFLSNTQAGAGPYWWNGCITAVKCWVGTAMTDAQLQQEAWSYVPKYPSPTFWYPLLHTETTDFSGNGRTLSGGTGATTEDGPGVGWGHPVPRPPIKDTIEVALGQASSTETAGLIHVQRGVGMAVEISTARSTKIEVVVDAATQINTAIEIVDPIAIGVTALTSATAAASAQSWSTASITPTGNRLVLACFAWAASTAVVANPIATVTGNGLTWALVLGQDYGAASGTTNARHRMEIWRALGPAPTAGAITVTHAAAQPGINRCWSVFEMNSTDLSGSGGSGAVRQTASNRSTLATTAIATLGAFGSTSNATVGFGAGASAMSVGTGFTAINTQIVTTPAPAVSLIVEWLLGTDTTVDANQTTSGQFGIIGLEIKRRFVEPLTGPPFETDLAQVITRVRRRLLGQPADTELARPITALKTKPVGQVVLTDTAQIVTGVKTRALGMATATHIAQAIARIKTVVVAQAVGTELAQSLAKLKFKAIGQTTEVEAAQALTRVRSRVVAQSSEVGAARAFTSAKLKVVAQAISVMAAQVVTAVRIRAIGMAAEVETARAMGTVIKSRVLGLVTGSSTAQALTHLKTLLLNRANSSELAQAITQIKLRVISQATTVNTATTLAKTKTILVNRSADAETSRTLTAVYVKALGMASSTHVAQVLTKLKTLTIAQVAGLNTALAISGKKTLALAQAASVELARLVGRGRGITQAIETSAARALVALKAKTLTLATETTTVGILTSLKRLVLNAALGTEFARLLGVERGLIQVVEPNHASDVTFRPLMAAAVGKVTETETAFPVAFVITKVVTVGRAVVLNVATVLLPLKFHPLTQAVETSTSQTVHRLQVDQVIETSTAQTVTIYIVAGNVTGLTYTSGTSGRHGTGGSTGTTEATGSTWANRTSGSDGRTGTAR